MCCLAQTVELLCFDDLSPEVLRPTQHVRIFVLDINSIGGSLTAVENLLQFFRRDILVISTPSPSTLTTMRYMDLGVHRVIDQELSMPDLEHHVAALLQRAEALNVKLQRYLSLKQVFTTLTSKENDVLNLILRGLRNNQISDILRISIRTVETRRANLFQKCKMDSLVDLVRSLDEYLLLRTHFE